MVRSWVVVFLAGMLASNAFVNNAALAQCRGGGGQGGSLGTSGTTGVASTAGLMGLGASPGLSANQGSGSLAYGMLMSQLIAQQMAQQQAMLAMQQQQQVKAEKLAARKYRAEQSRSAVAASRARTRAMLAAQSGLPAATNPPATLVAYNAIKR